MMTNRRDQLVLCLAFAVAVLLHAAALPWVGAAVGGGNDTERLDVKLLGFHADPYSQAGVQIQMSAEYTLEHASSNYGLTISHSVLLSRDRQSDDADIALVDTSAFTFFDGPSDALTERFTAKLPADADGPYWLIAETELPGGIIDHNPANNTRSAPLYIDGPQRPELAINRFDTPDQGLPGGSIVVQYKVENVGAGWANTRTADAASSDRNWIDRVYLSEDDRLDESDVPLRQFERLAPLGPGDTYRHERVALDLPDALAGEAYLILAADADQRLDQPAFTRGLAVKPIELVDTRAPDLVVAGIEPIDRLVIGRPTPVTFSIANVGNTATTNLWADGVFLSPEPVLDSRSIPLDHINSGQVLAPRERYTTDLPVTVPESAEPGQWYLVVKADASEQVDEPGFEHNNTLAVPVTVMTRKQADAEIQLGDPDRPERMVVQWIEHDRLEEHRARLSRTVQPALQDKADPVPDAPLIFDPQPPSIARQPGNPAGDPAQANRQPQPTENQDARPRPNAPDPAQTNQAPRPQDPGTQANTRIDGLTGNDGDAQQQRPGVERPLPPTPPTPNDPTPGDDGKPSPLPGDRKVDSPADPDAPKTDSQTDSDTASDIETDTDANNPEKTPTKEPSEQLTPTETQDPSENDTADQPSEDDGQGDADKKTTDTSTTPKPSEDKEPKPDGKPDQPSEASEEQTPTRAPRDDSEAPPTNNRKVDVELQEGRVLVGKGIKVTTKLPTPPGTGAARFSLPRNARISVTFNKKGEVHEARILRSTTYKEWDAAIEASLYRWSARGEAVEKATPYITIEWDYILNELMGDEQ